MFEMLDGIRHHRATCPTSTGGRIRGFLPPQAY